MLQRNAVTGLLFLAGVFYHSWIMGLGAVAGTVVGTVAAKLFRYSDEDIDEGLYGFNGALVGIAVCFYVGLNVPSAVALLVGAVLSTFLMHAMKARFPAFTAPFVLSAWLVMLGIKWLATGAILLSVLVNWGLGEMGVITLTAPFVLVTWLALICNKTI